MFVINFMMFEFVILPIRLWQLFSFVWPKIVYIFDDVSISKTSTKQVKRIPAKKAQRKTKSAHSSMVLESGVKLPPDIDVILQSRCSRDSEICVDMEEAENLAKLLEEKLGKFGIKGKITAIRPGPVITQFEYRPAAETKISKILALEDDLTMAMTAMSVRILAPIPGKNAVGFEIAHKKPQSVFFDELLCSPVWQKNRAKLPLVLGADGVGQPVIEDLSQMPHLLVAGSTGSGKSVCMHSIISSLLMSKNPDELKLVLIDPKRLEFAPYYDIPYLLFPVITHVEKATSALKWLSFEMERRYEFMAKLGVRNISEYQEKLEVLGCDDEFEKMPFIVVVVDELADLMMIGGRDVEGYLVRIAQMARAAGIHMVVATQRPSVDVVTGLIKVNFPSRIAFRVSSKVDSRTILDASGAEKLIGRGDMLFMHPSVPYLRRLHGSFVLGDQVERLASYLRAAAIPNYVELKDIEILGSGFEVDELDDLYGNAVEFVKSRDEISISMLQRQLKIGFNRSARIIDQLEREGIVAPAQGSKPRKVL
ncbi:DNA translocase FtsK [Candidatus Dependentiae bacterium]